MDFKRPDLEMIIASASAEGGDEFFSSLTCCLATVLELDMAFISELVSPDSARTISVFEFGAPGKPFEYNLKDTPCFESIYKGYCYSPELAWQKYPHDAYFQVHKIESYLALPLVAPDGSPIGNIGVLGKGPIAKIDLAHTLLELFSKRAAAEVMHLKERHILDRRVLNLEKRLRDILEKAPVMIHSIDSEGYLEFVSDFWLKKLGYTREAIKGKKSVDFLSPESKLKAKSIIADFFKNGRVENVPYEFLCSDGTYLNVLLSASAIRNDAGETIRSLAFLTDVTALNSVRNELANINQKLTLALEASKIGVWDWDLKRGQILLDSNSSQIWQIGEVECCLKEEQLLQHIYKDDQQNFLDLIKGLSSERSQLECEVRILGASSKLRHLNIKGRLLTPFEGESARILGAVWDVTDELETQKALATASKFAALGFLAGGVAHEVNNPLAIIEGYALKIRKLLDEEDIDRDQLNKGAQKIFDTTERIARVIRGMKSYSRDGSQDPMVQTSVAKVVDESLELCREMIKNNGVEIELSGDFSNLIICRPTEISQVFLNLIANSLEAIRTQSEKKIMISCEKQRDRLILSIFDNGPGVPDSIKGRIMDPFFTTKDVGEGTGLGLSISKSIMESHRGELRYVEGQAWTRFDMILPLAAEPC